jgi:hypothetical protein
METLEKITMVLQAKDFRTALLKYGTISCRISQNR